MGLFGFSFFKGNSIKGEKTLEEATQKDIDFSDRENELLTKASDLYYKGQFEQSLEIYMQLAKDYPSKKGLYLSQVGADYFYLGKYDQAIDYYLQARNHGMDSSMMDDNIWEVYEKLYSETGDNNYLEKYLEYCPNGTYAKKANKLKSITKPKEELSESGNPIYSYSDANRKEFTPPKIDGVHLEAITNHIEKHIGNIEGVYHELISHLVHIDIHWVKPSDEFPFHTLVTSGMSDKPMNVPEELEDHKYVELCVLLPPEWPMSVDHDTLTKIFADEKNYWPVRWLKKIARFVHEYDTWVGYGHTIPNGEEAEPFAENTKLGGILLMPTMSLGNDFFELVINENKTIRFYCLYPLYKEEMDFKLKKGLDPLLDKFEEYDILDIIDSNRPNTCARKGFFGR